MEYQDYIKLGFERTDLNDAVEFNQTGYYGYCLGIKLSDKLSISLSSGELDNPKLYIKKRSGDETYNIIPITGEIVKDLIFNPSITTNYHSAC